jgi:hypothetical protein
MKIIELLDQKFKFRQSRLPYGNNVARLSFASHFAGATVAAAARPHPTVWQQPTVEAVIEATPAVESPPTAGAF